MEPNGENAAKNTHNVVERLLFDGSRSPGEMKVLDLPCGEGAFTRRILRHGAAAVAADILEHGELPNRVEFAAVDMDRPFPFAADQFSDIVSIDGIEHIERQFDFVRECRRVLRPGGRLIISTPNISAARSRLRYFLTGHHNKCKSPLNETAVNPLHHKGMISFPELRYLLHTNGFEIETVTTNRIKPISYLYAVFYPLLYGVTAWVYRREEEDPEQIARNRDIHRMSYTPAIYFGETLIVSARKRREAIPARASLRRAETA